MATTYPGGRSLILQALQLGKVPKSSLEICLSSISSSTIKQYDVGLKLWWQFCRNKNIQVFETSTPLVLEFLTFHFNQGASYGSLNCYRSAIAQIAGPEISNDPRLKRFFKGVYSLRPNQPRYEMTWDPGIVLKYIRSLPVDDLDLKTLTQKTAVLIALATGHRVQTLSSIEIGNITANDDSVTIRIPKRIKTSGPRQPQPFFILPFFREDQKICVASAILAYLDKTKELRNDTLKYFFITIKKPHRTASTSSISRWIKDILNKSGIDTSIFKAHSTRHAATSTAARLGVSFDVIRRSAGWTERSKTFAKFYQRPLCNNDNFAISVLSS